MILVFLSSFYFYLTAPLALAAQDDSTLQSVSVPAATKRHKAYPGGRDEDDLKVQEELLSPTQTQDRRSIELKVLKTYFKKTDAELVAPGRSGEEEHPPTETE